MAVPAPKIDWTSDDLPTQAEVNTNFYDAIAWLYGDTSPAFSGYSTTASALANGATVAVVFDNETLKRGGITHSTSTNPTRITVPEAGWYKGLVKMAYNSTSGGTAGTFEVFARKNAGAVLLPGSRSDQVPAFGANADFATISPFRFWLDANDYIEFVTKNTTGSSNWAYLTTDARRRPSVTFFYDSKGA
jgi:hypothetical protein